MGRKSTEYSGVRERNGKIQIDFYYNAQRCRETIPLKPTPKNLKYAAQLRAAIEFDISHGDFDYAKYFPESKRATITAKIADVLFKDLLIIQLNTYQRRYNNNALAKSSLTGYTKAINGHLIPSLGNMPVTEITAKVLKNWIYTFDCRGKTIRNIMTPLRKTLQMAADDKLIPTNPLDELNLSESIKDVSKPKQDVINPFNTDEKTHLINIATGQFKNLVQFGFWSGLRTGELIALRWSDVDFKNQVINIIHNKVEGEEKLPKSRSGIRKVIMMPLAKDALLQQFEITGSQGDFVFHNPNTNKPWSSDNKIRDHWKKLFADGVVKYRYPYQMRHTFASCLLSAGENIAWIATQMGHINTEMVIRNYGKFIPDNKLIGGYKLKGDYSQ